MTKIKQNTLDANKLLSAAMEWQDGSPPVAKDMSRDNIAALTKLGNATARRTFTLFGVCPSKDQIKQASEIILERLLTQDGSDYDSAFHPCQYLRLMAMSACGKVARRRDRQFSSEVFESLLERANEKVPDNDPPECCIRIEREAKMRQVIQQLPTDQRRVLLDHYVGGRSITAMAKERDVTYSHIRTLLGAAKERLRRELSHY